MPESAAAPRPSVRLVHLALALALGIAAGLFALPTRAAADTGVTTASGLATALASDTVVRLDADIVKTAGDTDLAVPAGAAVTLDLNGHQLTTTGSPLHAGIAVPATAALTIVDTLGGGELVAQGGDDAAGIGSDDNTNTGMITISSGTVTATGGALSAGIGGGQRGDVGTILIEGGTVTATGGADGAGIGCGTQVGSSGSITITGGTVTATGSAGTSAAAGIGASSHSTCNSGIVVTGESIVTATGSAGAAGIGGTSGNPASGTIVIDGNAQVLATGGVGAAGIGGGYGPTGQIGPSGSEVTVGGTASVTAIGGPAPTAGLGGGGAGVGGGGGSGPFPGGSGGTLAVETGAHLTVSAPDGASAVGGGGSFTDAIGQLGTVVNGGTITVQSGSDLVVTGGSTLTNNGVIDGEGRVIGDGTVSNTGAIEHTVAVDVTVTGHHYLLTTDAMGGAVVPSQRTVYAPTLAAAGWTANDVPTPVKAGDTFQGWTVDAAGIIPATMTTVLGTGTSTGEPVAVTWFAQWESTTMVFLTDSLPDGTVGVDYDSGLAIDGGVWPLHGAVVAGDLPDGVTFDPTDGAIKGIPTTAGEFSVTFKVSDAVGHAVSRQLSITIVGPLEITTTTLPVAEVGADYEAPLAGQGGYPDYVWTLVDGALPDGLALVDGVITGRPATAGTALITVQVADARAVIATQQLSLEVVPALVVETRALPAGTVGEPYSAQLSASGGPDDAYRWALAGGSLPPGLTLSEDGTIDGVPEQPGTFTFTLSVNDRALADLTIIIAPRAVPEPPPLADTGMPGAVAPLGLLGAGTLGLGLALVAVSRRRRV